MATEGRTGQVHASKCTVCGGIQGYFSNATYHTVLLHGWDGEPKHDLLNAIYTEEHFRCSECGNRTRQPTRKKQNPLSD